MKKQNGSTEINTIVIKRPNILVAKFKIVGTAPYVQHRFSQKTKMEMLQKHELGLKGKNRKNVKGRDIQQDFIDAQHLTIDKRHGIPAPAFRSAMISACRLCGFQMTKAKLSVFVIADDYDEFDQTPLVLIEGKPQLHTASVRLETGVCSIAVRPMWKTWSAVITISFDGDQFSEQDVANLLLRAGLQVGVGEGRPNSKKSNGVGWGTFELEAQAA